MLQLLCESILQSVCEWLLSALQSEQQIYMQPMVVWFLRYGLLAECFSHLSPWGMKREILKVHTWRVYE